jgi:hypothetical protein
VVETLAVDIAVGAEAPRLLMLAEVFDEGRSVLR